MVGAGGQLGRALVASVPHAVTLSAFDRSALDLADADAVARALDEARPDILFNAAAYTAVDAAESDADAAYALNRDAVTTLAHAAERVGARLVHVSTDFVFDGTRSTPYPPDAAPMPLGVYGRSKAQGEAAALASPGALVVRTAWVYAAQGRNFVLTMLKLMRERPELRVVADQIGTPTHAASLARALWRLAGARAAGIYHYTDAGIASWYDFAVAIAEEAHALQLIPNLPRITPIATHDYPTPARRPAYGVLDTSATWATLGHPAAHWRVELRAMLGQLVAQHG